MFGQPLRHSGPGAEGKQTGCHRFDYIRAAGKENPGLAPYTGRRPYYHRTQISWRSGAGKLPTWRYLLAEESARRSSGSGLAKTCSGEGGSKLTRFMRGISRRSFFKEQNNSPENARTLKKAGPPLKKMERTGLNRPALELVRPNNLEELIGQEKAPNRSAGQVKHPPHPQHLILYGPPGVGKTSCARLALEMIKEPGFQLLHRRSPICRGGRHHLALGSP